MSIETIYSGRALSREGVEWTIEIRQEASEAPARVGTVEFAGRDDEPIVIEWEEKGKEECICGSSATVKLLSPGDRTYAGLYTDKPGAIRLEVYRQGLPYWSGVLDPEFYEEPYERADGYEVTLMFSDFGILDRLRYNMGGIQSLRGIIESAIRRSGMNPEAIDAETLTSLETEDWQKIRLEDLSVRSEDFYDEDGEAMTLKEVVEGVLQPLGLRMVQKAGKIWIYDLNGLHKNGDRREIYWTGTSQTMGVDRVINDVRITFSPYADAAVMSEAMEYPGEVDRHLINLKNVSPEGEPEHYNYHPYYGEELGTALGDDVDMVDFTIFVTDKETNGVKIETEKVKFFRTVALLGNAEDTQGVAWGFTSGAYAINGSNRYRVAHHGRRSTPTADAGGAVVMRTERVRIPALSEEDAKDFYLRLTLGMLLDTRYNPFEEAGDGNEAGNYNKLKLLSSWAMVPVAVNLYDDAGNAVSHYENNWRGASSGHLRYARGKWVAGEDTEGKARLEWYDPDDLKKGSGIQGWQNNRHCIGRPDTARRIENGDNPGSGKTFVMFESFKRMDDGEYMPYPPEGGWVEVTVFAGVDCYGWGEESTEGNPNLPNSYPGKWGTQSLEDVVRWHLYKCPHLEIVENNVLLEGSDTEDIEYAGVLNEDAKEDLDIATVCGTMDKVCPAARGVYLKSSDGTQVRLLRRAGVTDHPERLLIGTLYSQFAERKTTLSGECRLAALGPTAFTEKAMPGAVMLATTESQDLMTDTEEATFVELNPDEYEPIDLE